jgi:hypothetical protein
MTLLYATTQAAKHQILLLLQKYTNDPIVIPQTEAEIIQLARQHRPNRILFFMPGQTGAAVEIRDYLREFLPHARVRILPVKPGTNELLPGAWEKTVARAFHVRGTKQQKAVQS